MKKVFPIVLSIIFLLSISACGSSKEFNYVGVNAEILEISKFMKGIVVKGLDDNSVLGEKCYINCESTDVCFIYVDNISAKAIDLQFDDLVVGDKITVDIKAVENKSALTSRVQLLTQRK